MELVLNVCVGEVVYFGRPDLEISWKSRPILLVLPRVDVLSIVGFLIGRLNFNQERRFQSISSQERFLLLLLDGISGRYHWLEEGSVVRGNVIKAERDFEQFSIMRVTIVMK